MKLWIIGYDIANPKRLNRVHRVMANCATPIEYSVFLFYGTQRMVEQCLEKVAQLINQRADDVRCYPLPVRGFQQRIGRATLPEGIHWTALPAALYTDSPRAL